MSKSNISYVKLIKEALLNSCDGMLTLSEIYKSVSSKYPDYQIGKQVKSPSMICTIKYTLSLNPGFTKCTNQDLGYINKSGKGAYWKFSENQTDESKNPDRKGPSKKPRDICVSSVRNKGKVPTKCKLCEKVFVEKFKLDYHVKYFHTKQVEKNNHNIASEESQPPKMSENFILKQLPDLSCAHNSYAKINQVCSNDASNNDTANDIAYETTNDTSNDTANDTANDIAYDTTNDTSNDTANDTANDTTNDTANNTDNVIAKNTANGTANDTTNDTGNNTDNYSANESPNESANDTESKDLPEIFQQENNSAKSETIEIKREVKNEIKLENFEDFEAREQVGIDFITSNDFSDQNHQPDCRSKYLKSNITVQDEQPNIGLKDFFCDLCSLQFDKKYVFDVHMKLVHPNAH